MHASAAILSVPVRNAWKDVDVGMARNDVIVRNALADVFERNATKCARVRNAYKEVSVGNAADDVSDKRSVFEDCICTRASAEHMLKCVFDGNVIKVVSQMNSPMV